MITTVWTGPVFRACCIENKIDLMGLFYESKSHPGIVPRVSRVEYDSHKNDMGSGYFGVHIVFDNVL